MLATPAALIFKNPAWSSVWTFQRYAWNQEIPQGFFRRKLSTNIITTNIFTQDPFPENGRGPSHFRLQNSWHHLIGRL